jgi:predicted transcriptional regulator
MTDDVAIEAHISPELNEALARLASARGERKATLVREALAAYIRSEQEAAAPAEEGQAVAGADKPHVDVVRGIRQLLQSKR